MPSPRSIRSDTWQWPHGAKAAISFTYDDGNPSNLDQAMPDLEAAGFRGTFYLQTAREDMQLRVADWRAAQAHGHEIGNHTVHHWCRAQPYIEKLGHAPAWLNRPLESVSPAEIATEIATAADWLDQHIGTDPDRTFAHPCGALAIGVEPDEAAYDAAILQRHFAARTCITTVNHPTTVQMLRIGGFDGHGADIPRHWRPHPHLRTCRAPGGGGTFAGARLLGGAVEDGGEVRGKGAAGERPGRCRQIETPGDRSSE